MKTKTTFLHLISVAVLSVFVVLSIGSIGGPLIVQLLNGSWELNSVREKDGTKIETFAQVSYNVQTVWTKTGKTDDKGRYHGPYSAIGHGFSQTGNSQISTFEINMVHGKRHGKGISTKKSFNPTFVETETVCYHNDRLIDCDFFDRNSTIDTSAYSILINKYPVFYSNLSAYLYEEEYIENYMDTLEKIINSYALDIDQFDDYYDDALDEIEVTVYDSLSKDNEDLTIFNLLDLARDGQFRLAVFDQYLQGVNSLIQTFTELHPGYLIMMDSLGISNEDFEQYCLVFENMMNQFEPLDIEHYTFPDSIDNRIFRVFRSIDSLYQDELLAEINTGVVILTLGEFIFEADIIKNCLREAYFRKHDVVGLPVATTFVKNQSSNTETEIEGFVTYDGGGNVTERGIVWAQHYNPTIEDNQVSSGSGTGPFEVTINNLTPGEIYFARSYATNSAGTYLGNCVEFIAQQVTGTEEVSMVNQIKLFPNPASSTINIRFENKSQRIEEIRLFDTRGKQVASIFDADRHKLDISHLSEGIYHVQILFPDGKQAVTKVVVVR